MSDSIADILGNKRKDGSNVWEPRRSLTPEYIQAVLGQNQDLNFVQRYQDPALWPVVQQPNGQVSTHIMTSGNEGATGYVFPTLVWDPASQSLVQLSGAEAAAYAKRTGERISFPDAGDATFFGEHYKVGKQR
jgi:hypothetical protein